MVKGFSAHDRGQLIMACGTGKTLTALFITERLKAERTLAVWTVRDGKITRAEFYANRAEALDAVGL